MPARLLKSRYARRKRKVKNAVAVVANQHPPSSAVRQPALFHAKQAQPATRFQNWIATGECNRQPPVEAIANYGTPLPRQPKMKKITHITRNRKNKTFAIPADAAAMPPNPNTAATSAIIKKVTAQPNIVSPPIAIESY
jgi:hypothetical protein